MTPSDCKALATVLVVAAFTLLGVYVSGASADSPNAVCIGSEYTHGMRIQTQVADSSLGCNDSALPMQVGVAELFALKHVDGATAYAYVGHRLWQFRMSVLQLGERQDPVSIYAQTAPGAPRWLGRPAHVWFEVLFPGSRNPSPTSP